MTARLAETTTPDPWHSVASERVLGPRPDRYDPMVSAARVVNVAWSVTRRRLDAQARPVDRVGDLERELERLVAAVASLSRRLAEHDGA